MNKNDVINQIAKRSNLNRAEAKEAIEKFIEVVKENISNGEPIYIRGFGYFELKKSNKMKARNLQKNTIIDLPVRYLPIFKPYDDFLEQVAKAATNGNNKEIEANEEKK